MKLKCLLIVLLAFVSGFSKASEGFNCYKALMDRYKNSYDQDWFQKLMISRPSGQYALVKDGWIASDQKPLETQTTRMGKFFYALARGGLLWSNQNLIEKDLLDSLNRFEALLKEEPNNAAFYIYKAAVENELGKVEAAKATLTDMNAIARYYDSYYLEWKRELFKNYSKNIEEYLASVIFTTAMPRPDAIKIVGLGKTLNMNLERLGRFMVKEGLAAKEEDSYSTWDALEYSVGYSFISAVRKPRIPSLADLFKKHPYQVSEDYIEMYTDPKLCTGKAIDAYLENGRMEQLSKIE